MAWGEVEEGPDSLHTLGEVVDAGDPWPAPAVSTS